MILLQLNNPLIKICTYLCSFKNLQEEITSQSVSLIDNQKLRKLFFLMH